MRLQVIDLVANLGGGVRFVAEMIPALERLDPALSVSVDTTVIGAERYAASFDARHLNVEIRSHRGYEMTWLQRKAAGRKGQRVRPLLHAAGINTGWTYRVPRRMFHPDAEVIWFPWIHRHQVEPGTMHRAVGTFHDALVFQFPAIIPPYWRREEERTTRNWLRSSALLTVTSKHTVAVLKQLFGAEQSRVSVIELAGTHTADADPSGPLPSGVVRPFLIYPANISPHKNHDVLLDGFAAYRGQSTLVLTGEGSDFTEGARGRHLRALADRLGLLDDSPRLVTLGYVDVASLARLMQQAHALVMPSLGEGGGSFPVYEAMAMGVPVVCADIPVMREQLLRTGGEVLWFDPRDSASLTQALHRLDDDYEHWARIAAEQAHTIAGRSWDDVAEAYMGLFREAHARGQRSAPAVQSSSGH